MIKVPVISAEGIPLMPTKPSRARRWIKESLAQGKWSDLGVFYVQLIKEPSGKETQHIAVGIDPGKLYSGVGVQSSKATLFLAHLVLPFNIIRERMKQRAMMRRGRRGRRINRKVAYCRRAHRQRRFSNRRSKKIPPSIKACRELELRVVKELLYLFPITKIVYEYVKGKPSKSFSPVAVGQKTMREWLEKLAPVIVKYGYDTAKMRTYLKLAKCEKKGLQVPETHAVDGLALACYEFIQYKAFSTNTTRGYHWAGSVNLTKSVFKIIRRPALSRRQLHLTTPAKGNIRRKYGGSTTRHEVRKGDMVRAEKAGVLYTGWVSGDTKKHISVSDVNWKRLGQFVVAKVRMLARAKGLVIM